MTPEKFTELFPYTLCLMHVERGPHKERVKRWRATLESAYYTSDSDRLAWHSKDDPPRGGEGWGATTEEAVDGLVAGMLRAAEGQYQSAVEYGEKSRLEMAALRALVTGEKR